MSAAPLLGPVGRSLDALCRWINLSVGVCVLLMVGIVSYGVAARELFNISDIWVTEVTTYLMAYITFMGLGALAWQGRHLKVDVVSHFASGSAENIIALVSAVIVTAVAIVLLLLSYGFWQDAWSSGEESWGMLSMPLWIPYLALLFGSALLALVQTMRLAGMLTGFLPAAGAALPKAPAALGQRE